MYRELVVPVSFIVSFVHRESLVIDTLVVPFSVFVKEIHLFGDPICVNQVQIETLVLFAPKLPRCTPIIVLGDWDDFVDLYV